MHFSAPSDWHLLCFQFPLLKVIGRVKKQMSYRLTRYNPKPSIEQEREQDLLESVTEEEVIILWRSIKQKGLSEDEAWHAIVTGLALDAAFSSNRRSIQYEH